MRPEVSEPQPVRAGRTKPTYGISHAMTITIVAVLALAGVVTLDRAIAVGRSAAAAIDRTEREGLMAQRIASLVAQTELGRAGANQELRATIDAFERLHRSLVAGVRSEGIASAVSDPQLRAIYFAGPAPLDATATEFVTRARRIAALAPRDPNLGAHSAPLLIMAEKPLSDAFTAAVGARRQRADREIDGLRGIGVAIGASVLTMLLVTNLAVFRPMVKRIVELKRDADELARVATTDPLTGTLNRNSFQARGAIEIQKARRYQRPLSLLVIDADQLSMIEATHGPGGGETVLKAITSSFFAGTRVSDLVARVDAEQFAILLPETNCEGAELLAERLRRKISDLSVPIDNALISCTVSIGVAAAEKDASFLWPTFKRADEALYEAKMRGRNRVVVAA
jgi:diguanylate cyclase (GGDEF)-like protein